MKYLNTSAQLHTSLLTIFLLGTFIAKAQWGYIGETEFSEGKATNVTMDVYGEVPYLAYSDHENQFRVSVMKYNGTNWVYVGPPAFTAPVPDVYGVSLKMNGSVPYIAFMDRYFYDGIVEGKLTVMKFNGGIWGYVGTPGFSVGNANCPMLAFDGGMPFVAFTDETQNSGFVVMKFDGTNWVQVGPNLISSSWYRDRFFRVHGGVPYLAYTDKTLGNKPVVKKFDGVGWVNVGNLGLSGDMFNQTGFAISENGTPFLAHADSSTNGVISVLQFNGTDWVNVGNPNFTPDVSDFAFAIDGEAPYIVFSSPKDPFDPNDVSNLTVMQYQDAEWELVGPLDIIGNHYPTYLNIVIENGIPYIGFQHNAFGGGTTAMKYAAMSNSLNNLYSEKNGFRLYPNPSRGAETTFHLENIASDEALLQVFDLNGKRYFEQIISLETGKTAYPVRFPDLPSGLYLTKLTTSGDQMASSKLVVIH